MAKMVKRKRVIVIVFGSDTAFDVHHSWWNTESNKNSHVIYPKGKPMIPHLPAVAGSLTCACAPLAHCRRFAVGYYGFTFGALDLQHPRLLQQQS
ncbi:hypothetical protein ACFL0H_08155 [Thermodesulfobacteriota bacterium]